MTVELPVANVEDALMETKHRPRVHVFGPFEQIAKLCGLDLTFSLFNMSEARKEVTLAKAIISTALAVVIIGLILVKLIAIFQADAKAFTVEWHESNIDVGIILYGLAAAICLSIWSHQQFMRKFQEKIDAFEEGPVRLEESFAKTHIKAFVMSAIFMILVLGHSGKDVVYARKSNTTETQNLVLTINNLWGVDPLIRGLAGLTSCICTVIYVVTVHAVGRKLKEFNNDFKAASERGSLQSIDTLSAFSDRHLEVLGLLKFSQSHISKFFTVGVIGAILAHINAMCVVMGHKDELSRVYFFVMIGYLVVSGGLMGLCLMVPAKLHSKVVEAANIAIHDRSIWTSQNEKLMAIANGIVTRTRGNDLKMVFMGGFYLDDRLPHKLLILIPTIGNIMMALGKHFNK